MTMQPSDVEGRGALETFTRTRYFHGQLLEAHHLENEQHHLNGKRQLINRLILGYGVVAGLNVSADSTGTRLVVEPGFALDRAGREIVVPRATLSEPIAPRPNAPDGSPKLDEHCQDDEDWVHVDICFHECLASPERSFVNACDCETDCEHSAIRERFEIRIEEGRAKAPNLDSSLRDALRQGRVRYGEIVSWITSRSLDVPRRTCITLANVLRPQEGGHIENDRIDIDVRPVVFANDLLFELICELVNDDSHRPRTNK